MIEQNFPPDDELFQMVEKSHAAALAVAMKVHELAGGGLSIPHRANSGLERK